MPTGRLGLGAKPSQAGAHKPISLLTITRSMITESNQLARRSRDLSNPGQNCNACICHGGSVGTAEREKVPDPSGALDGTIPDPGRECR
jgi:hypothetical protein